MTITAVILLPLTIWAIEPDPPVRVPPPAPPRRPAVWERRCRAPF